MNQMLWPTRLKKPKFRKQNLTMVAARVVTIEGHEVEVAVEVAVEAVGVMMPMRKQRMSSNRLTTLPLTQELKPIRMLNISNLKSKS
jgi:hypothetical protein